MKLKTVLNGQTYQFKDILDVLAKANEPKSGDRLLGIAAETMTERIAAKIVLANPYSKGFDRKSVDPL